MCCWCNFRIIYLIQFQWKCFQTIKIITGIFFRVKSLQSQLSEKDAMLRIYQRSPMTRSSSVHTIYCTPHHSPRPSLIATGSLSRQSSQDASLFIKHKKTASSSALETSSKLSQDDLFQKIQDLQAEVNINKRMFSRCSLESLYMTVHYKMVLYIRQFKDWPQKYCIQTKSTDYIEKWP